MTKIPSCPAIDNKNHVRASTFGEMVDASNAPSGCDLRLLGNMPQELKNEIFLQMISNEFDGKPNFIGYQRCLELAKAYGIYERRTQIIWLRRKFKLIQSELASFPSLIHVVANADDDEKALRTMRKLGEFENFDRFERELLDFREAGLNLDWETGLVQHSLDVCIAYDAYAQRLSRNFVRDEVWLRYKHVVRGTAIGVLGRLNAPLLYRNRISTDPSIPFWKLVECAVFYGARHINQMKEHMTQYDRYSKALKEAACDLDYEQEDEEGETESEDEWEETSESVTEAYGNVHDSAPTGS